MIERNYLSFSTPNDRYKWNPEYKNYRSVAEINKPLNDYLNVIGQYQYKENLINKNNHDSSKVNNHRDIGLYSLEKTKKYVYDSRTHFQPSITESTNIPKKNERDYPIMLKAPINKNILQPNTLHLSSSTKMPRRIYPPSLNPNMDEVKLGSYLESKDSPEYLRQYDKEQFGEIDKYYKINNQNISVLSRFGDWMTLPPGCRNRKQALEKVKHGTYETSLVAPQWMDIHSKHRDIFNNLKENNNFKSFQWKNTYKDKINITMLIDKDQKNALPLYLRDSYQRYNTQV